MTAAVGLAAAAIGGAAAGWWLARRRAGGDSGEALGLDVGPHLLPDPALDWLRRAHGALGVWVAELDPAEGGPRAERIVDAERLTVAQIVAVDRRLEGARDREQSGSEVIDGYTLVFRGAGGTAVGILLPDDPGAGIAQLDDDLRRLFDGIRRKPQSIALAQARAQEAAFESVASVGLRLAYQIERMLVGRAPAERMVTAEVVVVATITETAARVIGVSGRADRRVLDSLVPPESELARVAYGAVDAVSLVGDPLGGLVADRRQRVGSTFLLPMRVENQAVGAAMLWLANGTELTDDVRAEVVEALANAAPRLARALRVERQKLAEPVDALTGLYNRRGFEEALVRHGARNGALIYLDLDRFKTLNETLGTAAGDAVLLHIARLLRQQVRASDLPARIGGEEFAIWVPEAGLELGGRVAERVRLKIGTAPWEWQGQTWLLSASFGVAACPDTGQSLADLPQQAEAALESAKRSGRNRIEKAG